MVEVKTKWIDCDCRDSDHSFRFLYFPNDKFRDETDLVYLDIQLNPNAYFFKRIWIALKYVFGKSRNFGHFNDTVLNKESVIEIRDLMNQVLAEGENEKI